MANEAQNLKFKEGYGLRVWILVLPARPGDLIWTLLVLSGVEGGFGLPAGRQAFDIH